MIEHGRRLAEKMPEQYGDDPRIAGWHLDNEHGDEPDCHCPICRKKFTLRRLGWNIDAVGREQDFERYKILDASESHGGINGMQLVTSTAVPEPSTFILAGIIGFLLLMKRKR